MVFRQTESLPDSWPNAAKWQQLSMKLKGKLIVPEPLLKRCFENPNDKACLAEKTNLRNPIFLSEHPSGTQSAGWLDAWKPTVSPFVVAAESNRDIAAGINFARENKIRISVKSTGHDYLGRSSAPNSLLLWLHKMSKVKLIDSFRASGCNATKAAAVPAVVIDGGAQWLDVYREVTVKGGRYVQGGGCTTVGAAGGFLQGGGFGSWSKKYGIAAANLLEAEIVLAD